MSVNDYEAICVFKTSLTDEKVDSLLSRFEKKITDSGGESVKTEKLGQKRFPFQLKKHKNEKEGLYVLIKFKGEGNVPSVLRDAFRVSEEVLRHLISRVPEAEEELAVAAEAAPQEEISGQSQ